MDVMEHIRQDTPENKVRAVFSGSCASLEQAGMQRVVPTPVEYRQMELDAVNKIINKAIEVGLVERVKR